MTDHIEKILEKFSSPLSSEKGSAVFEQLKRQPADSLLALIALCRADKRENKIDVGVGVFCDDQGHTPVMKAVKAAEVHLINTQNSKSYLGSVGDVVFFQQLMPIIFGTEYTYQNRLSGLQTPGGTGALRLAFDLIKAANPHTKIHYGKPTWANHGQLIAAVGLEAVSYPYYKAETREIDFSAMMDALKQIKRGDAVLLHGCCHNPTGCDLTLDQWQEIGAVIAKRGLLPIIDLAYQGLGDGLEEDARGLRLLLDQLDEAIITYSCDKNFGLYRERTGAIYVLSENKTVAEKVQSNLTSLARATWSMPPDHGAAIVRIILESDILRPSWSTELQEMQHRIKTMRDQLAQADAYFRPLSQQKGMFSILPLSSEQITRLRVEKAIYMAPSGRINIAGLTSKTLHPFIEAVKSVL
ncbi:MAG: amino acid aminotransferase [Zymomonas mobilis subsp. pomaceae]|uniref:amino acid aminotransferase n=1 Tax=Zymomonas mobilis TaxID=542 RepID=UPI0039E9B77A